MVFRTGINTHNLIYKPCWKPNVFINTFPAFAMINKHYGCIQRLMYALSMLPIALYDNLIAAILLTNFIAVF